MSTTSAVGDSGKISGQKMTFSQTCNLLSQYVKEKQRNLSITPNNRGPEGFDNNNNNNQNRATMNLFPVKEVAEDSNGCIGRTINLFPQLSGFSPLMANASGSNKRVSTEPPAAQMTIFYGGQVLVFNDLPADKAKEVMDLASSYEPSQKKRKVETPTTNLAVPSSVPMPNMSSNPSPNPTQNVNGVPNFGQKVIPATVARSAAATATDLPQTRKASLHRFLEKRKDRLVGKAPQGADVNGGAPTKPVDGKSWLGLGSLPLFQAQQQQL